MTLSQCGRPGRRTLCFSVLVAAIAGAPAVAVPAQGGDPCKGETTAELRACLLARTRQAETELQRYLEAARREARPPSALDSAQAAWVAYRDQACRAAAGQYEGGSLQPVVALDCRLRLTRERTRELWRAYLTGAGDWVEPKP